MFLVELVMQGVRGFQQLVRLRFQGGFNFIAAGSEAGKTTAADAVVRLLFPVNDAARMETLVSRAVPDASRGALVVYCDDSAYYRVIQDFSKRAVNLSQFNPSTKEFTLLRKDWESTAQFFADQLPGVSEEDYSRLFVFRRDSCAGSAGPAHPAAAAAHPRASAGKTAAQDPKLKELHETLRKAEEAADAEYKADAARIRLSEIGKKLERISEADKNIADLEAHLADLKACENLPENLSEMISNHENEQSQKMVKLNDVDKDIEGLTAQRDSLPPANLMVEKLFIAGVAVVALSLVAGLFILSDEQSYFFPIGIFGGVLLMGGGWYNSSRMNAQRREVQKEIDGLVKERADIEKKFQEGGATIMKFMKATGSSSAGELKDKADNYRHYHELMQNLREQQGHALSDQSQEQLQEEYGKQREEVAALEKEAKELSRYAVDTYSIRQEIDRLQGEASNAGSADFGFGGADAGAGFSAPAPVVHAGPGLNVLAEIAVASRLSGIEMETLVPAVESAAQRNLSTVSAGRYVKIEVGPDGQPLLHDKTGAKHGYGDLSHSTRDMACFCLRAGLVEAIAGKRRLPFVLDDPFTGLDPVRQQAACNVLRVLGTKTQVILFTSSAALKAPADFYAELK
jgi:DNA repair exonuclease SbcCD ATPase subunit